MNRVISRNISNMNKTLCVLGNSKVGDQYASKIVSKLKTDYNLPDIQLIGNGGEHMKTNHNMNSIIDLNDIREKVLYLWRYDQKHFKSMKFSPLHFYQHVMLRMNDNLLHSMEANQVPENLTRARPSAFIAFDNEYLSREMLINICSHYNNRFAQTKVNRPDTYLMTNTVRHWNETHRNYCDMAFYTLALKQINRRHYVYPSHYIGQYGAYEALKHLWTESGLFKHHVLDNSLLASRHHSLDDIEKARSVINNNFRQKNNIDPDATVIFFAPGNTKLENEYSLEAFRKGYNEYIAKNAYPSSLSHYAPPRDMFRLVISVQDKTESEKIVREFIETSQFNSEVIVVSDKGNEHYNAMCASDFGCVYNGQLLSAAAMLHLHCFTMQNMNDLHYFWHTWENRWLSELNVNADRPAIQEFAAGEFWFGKLCEKLWYVIVI